MNNGLSAEQATLLQIQNGKAMADSIKVARHFDKEHKNVLRDIENLECSPEFGRLNFEPTSYHDSWNREQKMYLMSRDGFSFLVMGFTGKQAAQWKERYIAAFNEMEGKLRTENEEGALHQTERELLEMYRKHLGLLDRHKKRGSKITLEEKKQIWELSLEGYGHQYIARKLGRDPGNIRRWQKLIIELAKAKVEAYENQKGVKV